jgi:hypothetical protein
LALVDKEL